MNWTVLVLVGIVLIALVVFLIVRNLKDEKAFEQTMNNDPEKPKDVGENTDAEEIIH